jgi:hypothetical protein
LLFEPLFGVRKPDILSAPKKEKFQAVGARKGAMAKKNPGKIIRIFSSKGENRYS